MNKILLIFFLLFYNILISVGSALSVDSVVNIPDPAFFNYLLEIGIDRNENGTLEQNETDLVGSLILNNKGISDLKGIEAFTNLHYLSCERNNISILDLSHNLLLDSLDCSSNSLTQLTLANNTKLKLLVCNNNFLTSLDVSANKELEVLVANFNRITTLNIKGATNLKELLLISNQLGEIDMSTNLLLEKVLLNINQLSVLDFSNNLNLKNVTAQFNYISDVNFKNNLELEHVDLFNNFLTEIDLSAQRKLVFGNFKNNPFGKICVSDLSLREIIESGTYPGYNDPASVELCGVAGFENESSLTTKYQIFPNPAQSFIEVKGKFEKLQFYNALGIQVLESNQSIVNVDHLSNGAYYIKVVEAQVNSVLRFIKE